MTLLAYYKSQIKEKNPKFSTRWHLMKILLLLGVYQIEAFFFNMLWNDVRTSAFLPPETNTFLMFFGGGVLDLSLGIGIVLFAFILYFHIKFKRTTTKENAFYSFELLGVFIYTTILLVLVFFSIKRLFMVDLLEDSLLCAVVVGVSSLQTLDLYLFLKSPKRYYTLSHTFKIILKLLSLVALLGCIIYVFKVLVLGDLTLEGVLFLPFLIGVDLKLSQVNSRQRLYEE